MNEAPAARSWWLRVAIALACITLTVLFAVALFPWDRLDTRVAALLSDLSGAEAHIQDLGPTLSPAGPGFAAQGVALRWQGVDASELDLDEVRLRPAWSLSWLSGTPAVHLELRGDIGRLRGTFWPGETPGFAGRIEDLDPVRIPPQWLGGVFPPLTGLVSADVDLRPDDSGRLLGRVVLDARDGNIVIPDTPIPLPYETLVGTLELGDGGAATLDDFRLEGPLASITGQGRVGAAADLQRAPLDLALTLVALDPSISSMLRNLGLEVPRDGESVQIRGTLASPEVVVP